MAVHQLSFQHFIVSFVAFIVMLVTIDHCKGDNGKPDGDVAETKLDIAVITVLPDKIGMDRGIEANREKGVLEFTVPQETPDGHKIERASVPIVVPVLKSITKVSYEVMLDSGITHEVRVEPRTGYVLGYFECTSVEKDKDRKVGELRAGAWSKVELDLSAGGYSMSIDGRQTSKQKGYAAEKTTISLVFMPKNKDSKVRLRNVVVTRRK
jgi:HSP20 family molecular chaperone IbpA